MISDGRNPGTGRISRMHSLSSVWPAGFSSTLPVSRPSLRLVVSWGRRRISTWQVGKADGGT